MAYLMHKVDNIHPINTSDETSSKQAMENKLPTLHIKYLIEM